MRVSTSRRLVRDERGASALEFAILALPFLLAMIAVFEYGYVYIVHASLDTALTDTARLIRTGQAQTTSITYTDPSTNAQASTSVPMTSSQFAALVCSRMVWVANCKSSLLVSAEVQSSFTGQTSTPPTQNGQLVTTLPFNMGADRCIVLIHGYYPWQLVTPSLWMGATKLNGNNILLSSAALIMNEPYSAGSSTPPANAG